MLWAMSLIALLPSCDILRRTGSNEVPPPPEPVSDIMLIGTYTGGGSEGVYSFAVSASAAKAEHVGTFKTPNPTSMVLDKSKGVLYIANETTTQPSVTAAAYDRKSGELKLINQTPTLGNNPLHISRSRNAVVVANSRGGSFTLIKTDAAGTLGRPDWRIELGTDVSSAPQSAVFAPGGRHLYVTDSEQDKIFHFRVHDTTPPLTIDNAYTALTLGTAPGHLIFDKSGKHAYLISIRQPKVFVFIHDDGTLMPVQELPTTGASGRSHHVGMSADGQFVYVSHSGAKTGLSVFSVERSSGRLSLIGFTPTGAAPLHFALSPSERYVAVACQGADKVEIFERNASTGSLTPLPFGIQVADPAFIIWTKR